MNFARCARHLCHTRWALRRRFPEAALQRIESAVLKAEKNHSGEIRVALEGDLDLHDLLRDKSSRERAAEVFSQLDVWDTARSNGVLIYVLLADRDVEILADRGFEGLVDPSQWERACRAIEAEFSCGRWEQGLLAGIEAVSAIVAMHFPVRDYDRRNLPDRPASL